jgi:hypothetical protein
VNIKLSSVASNIVGKSGRAILAAIVNGRTQPEYLAGLAVGKLKAKTTNWHWPWMGAIAIISAGC